MSSGLLARRPRLGCLVASVIGAPLLGLAAATVFGIVDAPEPIPEALAQAAFEREASEGARIGLAVASDRTEPFEPEGWDLRESVALAAGECVGVTATSWGFVDLSRVAIAEEDGDDLVRAEQSFAMARAAHWCTAVPRTLIVRVEAGSADTWLERDAYSEGQLRWQIARGRVPGLHAGLTRGVPTQTGARAVPREVYLALGDRAAAGRSPIGPPIEIAPHRARLLPESTVTYDRLHALADNGRGDPVEPRWDALPADVPRAWRPLAGGAAVYRDALSSGRQTRADGSHPAIAFRDGAGLRTLLVLAPAHLGAECVTVQLTRMLFGYESRAERLDAASRVTRDGNVVSQRVCRTGPSTVVYVAPADDHARYLLRLFEG